VTEKPLSRRAEFFRRLWRHPGRFEGIKCKTSLPLDWVEEVYDEAHHGKN
jgi:hypothetical protein